MLIPLVLVGLGVATLALLYIIYKPPVSLIQRLQRRWPDVLFHVPTEQKIVALTIDDGPSASTASIQQVLDDHGAKATFFLIGAHIPGREGTLRDLVRHGHELANHAMHDEPSRSLSSAKLIRQVQHVEAQIEQVYASAQAPGAVAAVVPRYFRPGSGFFTGSMRKIVTSLDYRLVLGSIYPHDAQVSLWRVNASHVLSMVRPGGIVVCHDRAWTAPMLSRVLAELRTRGYRAVTVSELLSERRR